MLLAMYEGKHVCGQTSGGTLQAEIGRKPGSDLGLEREGYALAAGLALGLVTLGELHSFRKEFLTCPQHNDDMGHFLRGGEV